jgi:hypothetical protein
MKTLFILVYALMMKLENLCGKCTGKKSTLIRRAKAPLHSYGLYSAKIQKISHFDASPALAPAKK